MSTEAGSTGGRSARARRRRLGFGALVGIVVGVLAALAVGLGVGGAVAPPRISSVAVAPEALVTRLDQRVVLTLNQPVAADGLRLDVSPAADAELTADGAALTVRFTRMLDYATTYRVAVDGVRGTATGAGGRIETSFTTPDEHILLAAPSAAGEQLVRASVSSAAAPEVVYEAERISEFVRVGPGLVVIAEEGGRQSVHHPVPGAPEFVMGGPEEASYRSLRAAPDGRSFGYVMTSPDVGPDHTVYDSVLFLVDAATDIETEVVGFDGAPISVADWTYVRGTTSLLVRSTDQQGYLIDTTGGDPVPLGTVGLLRGFVPGTTAMLSDRWPDTAAIELTTGEATPVTIPDLPLADGEVLGDFAALGAGEYARIVHVFVSDPLPRWASSTVSRVGADGVLPLFQPPTGAITGMCASPNAQLLALSVVEPRDPEAAPRTYLVDSRTGSTVRTVVGARPDWCALD